MANKCNIFAMIFVQRLRTMFICTFELWMDRGHYGSGCKLTFSSHFVDDNGILNDDGNELNKYQFNKEYSFD